MLLRGLFANGKMLLERENSFFIFEVLCVPLELGSVTGLTKPCQ